MAWIGTPIFPPMVLNWRKKAQSVSNFVAVALAVVMVAFVVALTFVALKK